MLKSLRQTNSEGFTIIEVMIVLAIAGLILLIVFLAVPALQRNSRNTSRKNDVAQLLSAVSDYVSNNSGQLPTASGQFTTEFTGENPKLGYYTTAGNITWTYNGSLPGAAPTATSVDKVQLYNYLTCNGNVASTTGASARSVVAIYQIESGSGAATPQCVAS